MLVGSAKPGIGGELLADQKIKPKYSVYPQGQGSHLPSWVAFDKQVNSLKLIMTLIVLPAIHTYFCPQLLRLLRVIYDSYLVC